MLKEIALTSFFLGVLRDCKRRLICGRNEYIARRYMLRRKIRNTQDPCAEIGDPLGVSEAEKIGDRSPNGVGAPDTHRHIMPRIRQTRRILKDNANSARNFQMRGKERNFQDRKSTRLNSSHSSI